MHLSDYIRSELAKFRSQLATLRRCPGTLALGCLVLGMVIVQMKTGGRHWIREFGAVPATIDHLSSITKTGEGQTVPAWLTVFTYMFVHEGWMHGLLNTLGVLIIGGWAEPRMGTPRFLLAYLVGGLSGAFGAALVLPHGLSPTHGASLAFCYVLGAYWAILALEAIRLGRRANLIRGAEAAVAVLLVWRVAVRSGLSEHECGILIHVLSMSFGWFTVRLWSGLKRLRPMAYGSAA